MVSNIVKHHIIYYIKLFTKYIDDHFQKSSAFGVLIEHSGG